MPYGFVTDDGIGLGNWISIQRKNRSRDRLSGEQIAALDALGMVWDARKTA